MMKKEIYIKNKFASEVINELPPHAYINKTVCGVGMTSVALENEMNTLLLVPTKLLVENKANQYPNERCRYHVLGITGDTDDITIADYVKSNQSRQPLKVICTYDSFHRAIPFASRVDVRIVVDESDMMISLSPLKSSGNMEKDVITSMLEELRNHQDRVSFISSTPVPLEYFMGTPGEWISGLDQYVFKWPSTIVSAPMMCKRKNPVKALKKEVIEKIVANGQTTIGDRTFGKVIVFMNSVVSICKVINDCDISTKSGIICGSSSSTKTSLFNYGLDSRRVTDYRHLPTFTFVTSTGFQGIDLEDSEAMNIIVTKGTSDVNGCFMLDLQLDVKQAISRNRCKTNRNADRFIFFYNQGVFDKNPQEIESEIAETVQSISVQAEEFNKITILDDEKFLSDIMKRYTYRDNNGRLSLNNLVFSYEKYRAIEVVRMYHDGFTLMSNISSTFAQPIVVSKPREYGDTSYKAILDKYSEQQLGKDISWTAEELACENYVLISRCEKELGQIYNRSNTAKTAIELNESLKTIDISSAVKKEIGPGKWMCNELKQKLQEIYDGIGYKVRAKATDIYDYYPGSSKPIAFLSGKYINVK